ncbi:MAG TPA: hypothetical protein VHO70_17725 [Chitinispirillaceae bacterium]|nr:hypothetical protein [Chitinispirillaceae bacterium]
MDNAKLFEQMKEKIVSFPSAQARAPSMPLRHFLQLSEILLELTRQHKEALTRAKFKYSLLEGIPELIGALRHLMSAWTDVQFDKPETQLIWKTKQAEGEKARFELLAALRLIFHDDEAMLAKIKAINEGGSNSDSIQDLSDIVYIVRENLQILLDETELTVEMVDNAAALATELGQIYARAVVDRSKSNELLQFRNNTYTMIEDVMEEIERRGFYAYRDDSKMASLFSFTYAPIKRKKKESVKKEVAAAVS